MVAGPGVSATVTGVCSFGLQLGKRYALDVAPTEDGKQAYVLFEPGEVPFVPMALVDVVSGALLTTFNPIDAGAPQRSSNRLQLRRTVVGGFAWSPWGARARKRSPSGETR